MNERQLLITGIDWQHPWAFLLFLVPVVLFLCSFILHLIQLRAYADQALLAWVIPRKPRLNSHRIRIAIHVLAWLCLTIALAGPRTPLSYNAASDLNLVLIVDVSKSMSATDVFPNRLEKTKLKLYELLENVNAARFSIVVFAARAHLYVPFTSDRDLLRYYIARLDSLVLPTRGSEINSAIQFANQLKKSPASKTYYIVCSDGDFHQHIDVTANTPPVYVLGVGSVNGSGIPGEEGTWLEYRGRQVVTRLDEASLRQVAALSHGAYRRASEDNADWNDLLTQMNHNSFSNGDKQVTQSEWQYLYRIPLLAALCLFFISAIPLRKLAQQAVTRLIIVTIAMAAVVAGFSQETQAASAKEAAAYNALDEKHYQQAIDYYQSVGGYQGHFGSGVAYYLSNQMYQAANQFQLAVLTADNDQARAKAIFNLANTQFRLGDYEMAIQLYQNTLQYRADYPAAKNNLALAQTIWKLILKNIEQIDLGTQMSPGSGPRERVANNEDLQNFNASLAIANENKTKFQLPALPKLNKLVEQGMEKFRIAAKSMGENDEYRKRQKINAAKLAINQLKNKDPLLWKSLFEIEEGFPAPQTKPVEVPGVAPW